MNIRVQGPDGVTIEFPAGTDNGVITGIMQQRYGGPQAQPAPVDLGDAQGGETVRANAQGNTRSQMPLPSIKSAYQVAQQRGDKTEQRAMADAYVQREKQDSPIMMGIDDRVRSVARGVPFIGEYLDEATARAGAPFDAAKREEILDYQRARDRRFDTSNPYQSMTGKAVGGIGGTIAALPAAGAVTGGNLLLGAGAKTLPGAIGRGAFAGAVQGGVSGYGRGDETQDGSKLAMQDAALGLGFGAAVPAALGIGKRGFDALAQRFAPGDALSSVPDKAREFLMKTVGNKDALQRMEQGAAKLGPEGMLADVSPEMLGIAQGAASRPGSRAAVVDALTARDQAKNARINSSINETLGPVVEPSAIRGEIKKSAQALSPQYEAALSGASRVDTTPLAQQIDAQIVDARGPVRGALENARSMLNIYGTKELDPNPRALLETRKALGGMIDEADRSGNGAVAGALKQVRGQVDDMLKGSVPNIKAIDSQRASLFRQEEALDDAPSLFQSGPSAARPADVATRVGKASPDEALRITQGARAEIDRIVGTNANDVAALRNFLKGEGDWNRQKLASVFGEDKASKILSVLDNETAMENTYRQVVGGSQTGVKQGFSDFLKETEKGVRAPVEGSAFGFGVRGAQKLLQRVTGANNEEKAAALAEALAALPIAKGNEARDIVKAMLARQAKTVQDQGMADIFGRAGAGAARGDDPAAVKAAIAAAIMGRDYAKSRSDQAKSRR